MKHVLAPVPAAHLPDAIATFRTMGSVMFGSNQFELLHSLSGQAVTVWIVASTGYLSKDELPPVPIGKVLYRGRLGDIEDADRRGRPTRPALRPASTAGDTEWHKFYEVKDIVPIDPPLPAAKLRKVGGGAIEVAPHMLVLVEPPEGLAP